jgi:hypothetical protein
MAQPIFRHPLLLIGVLAAVSGPVHAQQPPDVVQSDPTANTAMGSNALFFNTSSGSRVTGSAVYVSPEPQGPRQYGLIAEEVEKVYPELVIRNDDGGIEGVRYEQLAPMLLNEVQQQQRMLTTQAQRLDAQEEQIAAQAQQLEVMQLQVARVMELERTVRASLMKSQYENRRAGKL